MPSPNHPPLNFSAFPPPYSGMAAVRLFSLGGDQSAQCEHPRQRENADPRWDVSDCTDDADEDLGSKEKRWLFSSSGRLLFKEGKNNGQNWAEVAASEICGHLGIPYAPYALAVRNGRPGVVSPDFCARSVSGHEREGLFFSHAGDELRKIIRGYNAGGKRQPKEYTVAACVELLQKFHATESPIGSLNNTPRISRLGFFVGYLMLDALIGNNDRHHENWGFLRDGNKDGEVLSLAPTFDHASGFGKNPDKALKNRLCTQKVVDDFFASGGSPETMPQKIRNIVKRGMHVEGFCENRKKARRAFYDSNGEGVTPLEAFVAAANAHPEARDLWMSRLQEMNIRRNMGGFFENARRYGILSDVAAEFSLRMLEINRKRLLCQTKQ